LFRARFASSVLYGTTEIIAYTAMEDKIIQMTPTKISTAIVSSRTILAPKKSLTYQNCEELEAMFNDSLNQHKTEIILDFKAVSFVDSETLELLLRFHEEFKNRGGRFKIIGINTVCRDILNATRLINVFNVYEDIHQAIKDVS
jgi:anti-anti-sigma factor